MQIGRPYHVAQLIAFGPPFFLPKPLPVGFVEAIVAERGRNGLIFRRTEIEKPFQRDEIVRVLEGPFRSFLARVVELDEKMRVRVMLTLFGRECEAVLPIDSVMSA
jgi:transcription antitermination factor NusG